MARINTNNNTITWNHRVSVSIDWETRNNILEKHHNDPYKINFSSSGKKYMKGTILHDYFIGKVHETPMMMTHNNE